jgi:hypothetical protein
MPHLSDSSITSTIFSNLNIEIKLEVMIKTPPSYKINENCNKTITKKNNKKLLTIVINIFVSLLMSSKSDRKLNLKN